MTLTPEVQNFLANLQERVGPPRPWPTLAALGEMLSYPLYIFANMIWIIFSMLVVYVGYMILTFWSILHKIKNAPQISIAQDTTPNFQMWAMLAGFDNSVPLQFTG